MIHNYGDITFKFQCTACGENGEISLPAPRPAEEGKSLGLGQFPSKPFMVVTPVKATIWKYRRALRWIVIVQVRWPFICLHEAWDNTFHFQVIANGENGVISLPVPIPVAEEKSLGIGLFPSRPLMVETCVKGTIWMSSRAIRMIVQVYQ